MHNKNLNVFDKLSSNQRLVRFGVAVGMSVMVAAPGLALAAPSIGSTASYQLSYSANDLRSVASTKALHKRIRRIARAYCPDYSVTRDLSERASCVEDVESDLVSQVNHPRLTKVHSGDAVMAIAGTNG